jgi:hypothetical protein
VPSFDGGDDAVGIGGPDEGFGVFVGLVDEAVDGGLQLDKGTEDAALQTSLGKLGEEPLDGVEPRRRGRCVVKDKARMPVEPGAHLGVLVGAVVVEDDVDDPADRDGGFDAIEKADELLMSVTLYAAVPSSTLRAANGSSCRCADNRGASCRRGLSASAATVACGRGPGSATSRRATAPRHAPADRRSFIQCYRFLSIAQFARASHRASPVTRRRMCCGLLEPRGVLGH